MPAASLHTLPKGERLSGKRAVESLLKRGRYFSEGCLRVCHAPSEQACSRILVSVPKRNFKRAVKRNLLKRRIRESFRLEKEMLEGRPTDLMFFYTEKEVLPFETIRSAVKGALAAIAR